MGREREELSNRNALEAVGIGIASVLGYALHHTEFIAAGVGIVIGLHFIPLGKIFHRTYYWVGCVMTIWNVLVVALRFPHPVSYAAIGTGAILWMTAIHLLIRSRMITST